MKRILYLTLVACLLLALTMVGCSSQTETMPSTTTASVENPDTGICPLTVMIDGKKYIDWGLSRYVLVEDEQILGYITSVVDIKTVPKQDNEANFPAALDAPYALWNDEEYGQVYVIKYGDAWHILLSEEISVDG